MSTQMMATVSGVGRPGEPILVRVRRNVTPLGGVPADMRLRVGDRIIVERRTNDPYLRFVACV